ncbi:MULTISPECIES: DUF1570 domain-containing protein [Lysobacteraceae]|nr:MULTISPECIES: DUF1570 domain-containing protein [Lysobacter]
MKPPWLLLIAMVALVAAVHGWMLDRPGKAAVPVVQKHAPRDGQVIETTHYLVRSNATMEQTRATGEAVEKLHAAYLAQFAHLPHTTPPAKLQLVLYGTRSEFKAWNSAIPWAEARYVPPECRAYVADGANPYHWMLHEAAHQLAQEVMHFQRAKWIDEGLAGYFGASRIDATGLHPGDADRNAYPIWWLPQLRFSGNLASDVQTGRVIPLKALIDGSGPPIASYVNLYYVEWWSLVHFLLHHDGGKYAPGFERLLQHGASVADFEREIGPLWAVQVEWYAYLLAQQEALRTPALVAR